MNQLITVLGPTATGKTHLAAHLAFHCHGQIISADSRQVFRGMDIGTGKDLEEYEVYETFINHHLIDIKNAGEEYSLFEFLSDYKTAIETIQKDSKQPILCGGTTLYLDAVLNNYEMINVPQDFHLPSEFTELPLESLRSQLHSLTDLHNSSDSTNKERALKALRIALYEKENPDSRLELPQLEHLVFGIQLPQQKIKEKISIRLKHRLKNGMIQEAERLVDEGVSLEMLKYYGLEYKYLALFLSKEINFNDLYQKLNSAIHEFAKKQMTRYRKMEKEGLNILWIDGELPLEDKLDIIRSQGVVFDR